MEFRLSCYRTRGTKGLHLFQAWPRPTGHLRGGLRPDVCSPSAHDKQRNELSDQPNDHPRAMSGAITTAAPPSSTLASSQAPDFKQVRRYLRTVRQREALGQFIEAGLTPAELAELAPDTFLAHGKTYPTAASYRYEGADHPYSQLWSRGASRSSASSTRRSFSSRPEYSGM